MKLTIENFPFRIKFGEEAAFRMIKEAGFDGVDYSFNKLGDGTAIDLEDHIEKAKEVKKLLEKYDLCCQQAHAPFKVCYEDTFTLSNKNYCDIVKSMEFASILGAKSITVHSIKSPSGKEFLEKNFEYYKSLEQYAEQFGIKIAVENLVGSIFWTPLKLEGFLQMLDSSHFCVCFDVGHAAITGMNPENYIKGLKKGIIESIHMHDTDNNVDRHWIPYQGLHNWERILENLSEHGYQGDMNLEVIHSFDNLPEELYFSMLKHTAEVGKHLIDRFMFYRSKSVL